MFSAILMLVSLPITDVSRSRGLQFKPFSRLAFFCFVSNFLVLMVLGAKHVEYPFIGLGQVCTALYFLFFIVMFFISKTENTLTILATVVYPYGGIYNYFNNKLFSAGKTDKILKT